jgi:transcriptional regulator with XRE-family HTH domain
MKNSFTDPQSSSRMSGKAPDQKLGDRLRELREATGATQKQLAHALHVAASSISGYEQGAHPPPDRLRDVATFIVTRSRGSNGRLPTDKELTGPDLAHRDELFRELMTLRHRQTLESDPWTFPAGERILLVCGQLDEMVHPYSDIKNPNYTSLLTHADLDAFIELYGHLRVRNPQSEVRFLRGDRLSDADDFASHLVVLGGPGLNEGLQQIFAGTPLPIAQKEHPDVVNGEVFYVRGQPEPELPLFAGWETQRLVRDVGLFVRLTNPFNTGRTLSWCSGIFSRGVLGAAKLLTDPVLRDSNGKYLAERFAAARQFAVLFGVTVVLGETITPDLSNDDTRLYEWSDVEGDGLT